MRIRHVNIKLRVSWHYNNRLFKQPNKGQFYWAEKGIKSTVVNLELSLFNCSWVTGNYKDSPFELKKTNTFLKLTTPCCPTYWSNFPYSTVVFVYLYINKMKTTFVFFLLRFQTARIHINRETKRSCQITASLCLLVKPFRNQNLDGKVVFVVMI